MILTRTCIGFTRFMLFLSSSAIGHWSLVIGHWSLVIGSGVGQGRLTGNRAEGVV